MTTTFRVRPRESLGSLIGVIDREAERWSVPIRAARAAFLLPIIAAVIVALTVAWRPLYRVVIDEDGLLEWLQVGMLVVIVGASAACAWQLWRRGHRALGLLFVAAAVAALFIAGEEVSWGQRILGWGTPEELAELNRQGETNLHNIGMALTLFHAAMIVGAMAALVLPFVHHRLPSLGRGTIAAAVLVPPVFVASGFAIALAYRLIRSIFLPEARYVISRYQELTEAAFYFSVLVFVLLVARRLRRHDDAALRRMT